MSAQLLLAGADREAADRALLRAAPQVMASLGVLDLEASWALWDEDVRQAWRRLDNLEEQCELQPAGSGQDYWIPTGDDT